jgi:hypothetical protein
MCVEDALGMTYRQGFSCLKYRNQNQLMYSECSSNVKVRAQVE